ncbi:hypothetical protein BG015_006909 [Linnemannia schmuckeri]|uniref:Arm-like repeat domain-containing protein n=1 Tax=Linnemannia schmuckeri TaxID=64567 RepID=A0A9P5S6A1_9FUNG|nr:hypothetical protein BG015_006909 [Linnemannia schmuckeri]
MTKDSHSYPSGSPPKPSPAQGSSRAKQVGDDKSVDSLHIRKTDHFLKSLRSSNAEPKINFQNSNPEPTIHHASSVSTNTNSVEIKYAVSATVVRNLASDVQPLTVSNKSRTNIFAQNIDKHFVRTVLPDIGARIDTTPQLALCLGLLSKDDSTTGQQGALLQGVPIDTGSLPWIKALEQDPFEQDRTRWLGVRMVEAFIGDPFKDSTKVAEIVLIGAALEQEHYRKLLSSIITEFGQAIILDVDLLQGLIQLVQFASPDFLNADDLVKILSIIRTRLQGTHQQSTEHSYYLTLAVSRILDVMVEHKVQDLRRVEEHEPLAEVLSSLKGSSDPYLLYQACYAFQALQYVPDDEIPLQTVLRHSTGIANGLVQITAAFKLDLSSFLEGLDNLQESLGGSFEVTTTVYEGVCSLIESGQGVMESLKEEYGSGKKRPWYAAIRAAYALAQVGRLKGLNELIYKAPCRYDPLFQWGICQLLGEIAFDSIWDVTVRQQAIYILGDLYKDVADWGQDESVKSWMRSIISEFGTISDQTVQEFLASDKQVMLILGDSDAGKSTFKHLESELLRFYKSGDAIPLFISLPGIDEPNKDMIEKQLRAINFSDEQIHELKLHRRLVLICDGYDESQQVVNLHKSNMLNQPGQWNTKMIISCRTQYLGRDYRSRFLPQGDSHYSHPSAHLFQEAVIAPFSKKQIEDYVEQYVPFEPRTWTTQSYMDKLTMVPNLMDLVKNPFLLTLALEALPDVTNGKKDLSAIRLTRVELYDVFVEHWLDVNKRRLESNTLTAQECATLDQLLEADFVWKGIDFSKRLASAIFEKQVGKPVVKYIHLHDKNSWRAEFFGPDPEVRLLRESIPLNRTGSLFRFLHWSMLEYFFSRLVFDPVSGHDDYDEFAPQPVPDSSNGQPLDPDGPLFRRNLLKEPFVVQFLSERVQKHPNFKAQLLAVIEQSKADTVSAAAVTAAANSITILARAGVNFNGADLRGIRISGADLSDGQFDLAQFQGADLRGVNLARTWQRQADFSDAKMKGVQFGELPFLQEPHKVCSCAYSPDGKILTVGLQEGQIITYDTATWECLYSHKEHSDQVNGIAFSPDSQRFVSGSDDSTVRVWDSFRGEVLFVITWSHRRRFREDSMKAFKVNAVAFSPCGKQFAAADGKLESDDNSDDGAAVRLWSSDTGERLFGLKGFQSDALSVQYSSNGRQVASVGVDHKFQCWNSETGELGASWNAPYRFLQCIAFSPEGQWMASGHLDGEVQLWTASLDSWEASSTLLGHIDRVTGVAFSPNSQFLASSSWDHTVRLWDVSVGSLNHVFIGHADRVDGVSFSSDGRYMASEDDKGVVRLWKVNASVSNSDIRQHVEPIYFVAYSSDGRTLINSTNDGSVLPLDSLTGRAGPTFFETFIQVFSVTISPDKRQLAMGDRNGKIYLWNSQTGAAEGILHGDGGEKWVRAVAYSPCGLWLASIGSRPVVRLWNRQVPETESILADYCNKRYALSYNLSFSSTGHELAVGLRFAEVGLFDTRTRRLLRTITSSYESLSWQMCFSPSDQLLLVYPLKESTVLWDLLAGKQIAEVPGCDNKVSCVAFSPCGNRMASASWNKRVRIWRRQDPDDPKSWSHITEICGFLDAVSGVAWSPVAPMELVTRCRDGSVQVWRIVTGKEGSVSAGLIWTTDPGRLFSWDLAFKDANGLDPIYQKLLVQRGTV